MKKNLKVFLIGIFALAILLIVAVRLFTSSSDTKDSNADLSTVRTCDALTVSEGTDFDWAKVNSDYEFESCLLELAKNLESLQRMAVWLQEQGFSNVQPVSRTPDKVYLNAIWDVETVGSPVPFAINYSLFGRWVARNYPYRVQIVYSNGAPDYVTAMHPML